ncbi:Zn(II)2Cys6 transcription factor [Macrophomina phaseolina]|uniref:Zn(II)2Cys6 transcription factor n=1 Tax=Macrophomina phaseolina TaxID=35725 RepID=A0ABQ8GFH8_9PEZI|nr:Zn(II)2Cys6 transcription factor [Macrophomina phaseolina]
MYPLSLPCLSKIKCSGEEPCRNCQRRVVTCRFTDGGNKVTISESYLRELQRLFRLSQQRSSGQASPESQTQTSRKRTSDAAFRSNAGLDGLPPYEPVDSVLSVWTSPFTSPSATIKNTHPNGRKWIWLSPWSPWSFTVRLTLMMTEKLHLDMPNSPPVYSDGETYPLQWRPCSEDTPPDITGLPSKDHALYLFNAVKFHLSYRFFDDGEFIKNVNDFYHGKAQEKATESRLWFVQFLIVLAFGNAFLSKSKNPREPPGAKYFVRAMSLMPEHSSVWKGSLLAVEVHILAGLYLYSIDHREAAHVYLGQATRIAQLEGLHTRLPEEELGSEMVVRCRRLWWTLYIMDRHFSVSLGVPMLTADNDITTLASPSSMDAQEDTTIGLQVKLSQLSSVILTTIYKTEKTRLSVFLERTRTVLHAMAGHAQEIESIFHERFRDSVEALPPPIRHITLLYHQCVTVATRPLLLSLLKERLDRLDRGREDWQSFLTHTKNLISTGIKSAAKMIQILSDEDTVLEVFVPFDHEFCYGAALHLIMANALFPGDADEQSYRKAHEILEEMIREGNKVAEVRKKELLHLEDLFRELAAQSERRGLQTLRLAGTEGQEISATNITTTARGADQGLPAPDLRTTMAVPIAGDPQTTFASIDPHTAGNFDFLDNIGISSSEFLSIVDQIGNQDILSYGIECHNPHFLE